MTNELAVIERRPGPGHPKVWDRQEIVDAVADCLGNFSAAARLLSLKHGKTCHRKTVSDAMKENQAMKDAMYDIMGQVFDGGFSVVANAALDDGDMKAAFKVIDKLWPHYGLAPPPRETTISGTLKVQPMEGELTAAELKGMTNEQLKELIERGKIADKAIRDAGGPPDDYFEGL
jgi:hypothetical protein